VEALYKPDDEVSNNFPVDISSVTAQALKTNVSIMKLRRFKTVKCLSTEEDSASK
jgi:hypothetical protein